MPHKQKRHLGHRNRGIINRAVRVATLNEATTRRQDDLRYALQSHVDSEIIHVKKRLDDLRDADKSYLTEEVIHIKELMDAESTRVDEQLKIRAEFADRLATAEAKRIDAIRAVDVNAVAVASQRASDQATVLATQVAQSAEALRALVATTAATVAASQQQLANTLSARLTTLEQAQYEGKGKQSYSDPMMAELVMEMKRSRAEDATRTGIKGGSSAVIAYVVSGIIAFGGLVTIAFNVLHIGH